MATNQPGMGLETVQTNSPETDRKDGRKGRRRQTNRQVSLRPSASPAQRYTRPAQPQRNAQAEQLASALQSVSPTMGKLSNYLAEKKRKEADQQAQAEIQQMSMEEAEQLVQSGEMSEYENPYFQEAFQRQYGVRLGLAKSRELKTKFATDFNARSDDVDQFIAENLGVDMGEMSQNPLIQGGFTDAMEETMVGLRDEAAKQQAAAYEQDKLDGIYETYTAEIDRRLDSASTPEERQAAIDSAYQAIRSHYPQNKERLNMSNSEQDAVLMQVASRYARQGDADVVEKLLTDNRGGVGAIIDKRGEMGARAAEVRNVARSNQHEDNKKETFDRRLEFFEQAQEGNLSEDELRKFYDEKPGAMTEGHYRSLLRANQSALEQKREDAAEADRQREIDSTRQEQQNSAIEQGVAAVKSGSFHRLGSVPILKENGEGYEMVSPEKRAEDMHSIIQERLLPRYGQQFDEEVRGFRVLQREAELYSNNPAIENKKWDRTLKNVTSAFNSEGIRSGEVPRKIRDGFALYQNLKDAAPGVIDRYTSAQDRDIYEALRMETQYNGLELDQAVQKVYQMTQNGMEDNKFTSAQYREMTQAINDLDSLGDGWDMPENDHYVTSELQALAKNQARAGGASELETVVDRFKAEHDFINGWAVTTRGKNVPSNFKSLAEGKIQGYAETHRAELEDKGLSAEDLTLFPVGGMNSSGTWAIVEKQSASPMNDRVNAQFTISELQSDVEEGRETAAVRAINERNEERRMLNQDRPGGDNWDGSYGGGFSDPDQTSSNTLRPDEMAMDAPDSAEAVERLEQDPRSVNNTPASNEPLDLPEGEDPMVKKAVQEARRLGMNRADFKQYMQEFAVNPRTGQTALVNPRLRERIIYYLPPS